MSRREDAAEDDFVTKTNRSRKKTHKAPTSDDGDAAAAAAASSSSTGAASAGESISLRPRTMFTVKGRAHAETEGSSATYRPQWSKDGDGFVSNTPAASRDTDNESRGSSDLSRRKGKVVRYSKEELLALHVETKAAPASLLDAVVASDIALAPVDREPFDYDEVYKQWALNRNRGRGRGRTTTTGQPSNEAGSTNNDRSRSNGKWEEGKWDKSKRDNDHEGGGSWQRETSHDSAGMWDDVGTAGGESMDFDLSSMSLAAEKFRLEMDAMRLEVEGLSRPAPTHTEATDMDAFDQKLEEAVKAGQFEDSDEEVQWDTPLEAEATTSHHHQSHHTDENAGAGFFFSSSSALDQKLEPDSSALNLSSLTSGGFAQSGLSLEPEVVVRDEWFYLDPQGLQQGPFKTAEMREWFEAGYFKPNLPIQFGQGGVFTPLANHFLQGQIPFATMPRMSSKMTIEHEMRLREEQRLMQLHQQQQQQQQQRMLQLQHQQEQERLLQYNQEEKIRLEMQRMEMARQQHFQQQQQQQQLQQQQLHHQQQAVLQQQSSWQRTQREGIMSALGMLGGEPQGAPLPFQQEFRDPRDMELNPLTRLQESPFPGAAPSHNTRISDPWGAVAASRQPEEPTHQQGFFGAKPASPPPVPRSPVADPWATPASPQLEVVQEKPKPAPRSPPKPVKASPAKKESRANEAPWAAAPKKAPAAQSLKDIQEDEQRELRQNLQEERSDLAHMGAQLKMMLGVKANATATGTTAPPPPPPPPAPPAALTPAPTSASVQSTSTASPWGRAAVAAPQLETKKSMREILEEEERLAIERAKRSETTGTPSSQWMNVVAGTVAPKVSRLGPVPASVLKSTTRQAATATAAAAASASKKPTATPSKAESDASFWNFGAAQASKAGAATTTTSGASSASSVGFGNGSFSSEFMGWCAKQIKQINGSDDLTLVEYCATLEDPGEIREYLAAYLGSTPRVSAFATEFIQRKRSSPMAKKQVVGNDEFTTDKKGNKRRTKGQKIDPSLLNYSVGS